MAKPSKRITPAPKNRPVETKKVVDSVPTPEVKLPSPSVVADQETKEAPEQASRSSRTMTLTYKGASKDGKNAFYTGAATVLRFSLSAFPDRKAPQSFEVADGVFAAPKPKLTKEERKALRQAKPKPTLAERAAAAEARAKRLREQATAEQSGAQASL